MSTHPPLLDVQGVSYALAGNTLLAPVSLTLNAGDFLLLTGPSGCGKSTLLKIIASLLDPTHGSVLFKGQPVSELRPETYRQQVSWCCQTPALFGKTVWDNLALPWEIRHKKAEREGLQRWLQRVNLPAEMLDKEIETLSGGEKQRVGLLRNLQFLPDVLLLDEVTSALDDENKQAINGLINELMAEKGMAAIWISHDSSEIHRAQRVLTLSPSSAGSADEPA